MNNSLHYMKFSSEALEICTEKRLSRNAILLYVYYSLNCNRFSGQTHARTDSEIGDDLGMHRITILRARAELEIAGLIHPTKATLQQKHTYHLPDLATIDQQAEKKAEDSRRKDRQKGFAKEKASIENVLNRRLTQPELATLKRKHELDS